MIKFIEVANIYISRNFIKTVRTLHFRGKSEGKKMFRAIRQ